MSLWEDESLDDQYLAPGGGIPDGDDELAEDQAVDPNTWRPEDGFPDQENAVRVWGTPEGELTKVRISLSWREKLGIDGLSRAFGICFMMMNNYYAPPMDIGLSDPGAPRVTEQFTAESLDKYRHDRDELRARLAQLPADMPASSWRGGTTQGSDFEDGVIVQLDVSGRVEAALFDPTWLKTKPSAGSITRGVMAAYRRALRKHQPPQLEETERGRLQRELLRVNDRFFQMMANGVPFPWRN